MNPEKSDKGRLSRVAGRALARYTDFVRRTSTLVVDPPDAYEQLAANRPAILALWHGQFLMMPALQGPGGKANVMVARHGDGEIIAEVLRHYGSELIRGAGAGGRRKDRGGAHAMRAALRTLDAGISVAMTADIPPGPARKVGLGIITMARLSGRPIIPMAVASSRYTALDTWSRMTINLPFSRLAGVVGQPVSVPRDASPEQLEALRAGVEAALEAVTARAYELAGADPVRATPAAVLARTSGPPAPGFRLNVYRALTRWTAPALKMLLLYRRERGKEDPERVGERMGVAGIARPAGTLIWMHAASVGETNAILPVMSALSRRRPGLRFLLTTGTVTSAKVAAERLPPGALHQYIPLDVPAYVTRFLDHWRPDLGVFTEGEVWPNLVMESASRGIPLALVNGRMSNRSFMRWRRNRAMSRPLFGRFSVVLAQNERLARRFAELGAIDVRTAGNLKVDAPAPPVDGALLATLRQAIANRPCWVAASTHPGEDEVIADAHRLIAEHIPAVLTIIVPRHPERGPSMAQLLAGKGAEIRRRASGEIPDRATGIYVADTLGELGTFYALAPVAFIGGSLVPHGGQNPIEAVRHGAVVLTGPHTANFADTFAALLRSGAAAPVIDAKQLAAELTRLLSDPHEVDRMREAGDRALAGLAGGLDRTVDALLAILPETEEMHRAS